MTGRAVCFDARAGFLALAEPALTDHNIRRARDAARTAKENAT
jgi:hypothetical protein